MCGIYGEFALDGAVDVPACLARLDRLVHRGPDGVGVELGRFREGTHRLLYNEAVKDPDELRTQVDYFIGHRRLAIIDLSDNAAQPMETLDGRFVVAFNGEIYNHVELRRQLVAAGVKFFTDHSDTEVLLHAYAEWGEECLQQLRGMFAFVILDRRERRIFMARDPVGEKTLYYQSSPTQFAFSSEANALVHGRSLSIDQTALGSYLSLGYVLHPRSVYEGTKKLLPGCCGTLDLESNRLELRRYWDLQLEGGWTGGERAEIDWLTEVDRVLTESVRLRLRSDVSLGAFVSGGVDSAVVAKKVREILGGSQRFELFGADFPGSRGGQAVYMERVSRVYGHEMTNLMVGEEGAVNLDEILRVLDEPFDGGSSVAVLQLFREAKGRCKVMLTGDGGDELFAGYDIYRRFSWLNACLRLVRRVGPLRTGMTAALEGRSGRWGRLGSLVDKSRIGTYMALISNFDLVRLLKGGETAGVGLGQDIAEWEAATEAKRLDPIKMAQYLDFMTTLPGRMLYKVDRFSMYHSIEARVPLLDPDLARLAFAVPTAVNVNRRGGKRLLKSLIEKDLGRDFTHRKKEGFGNPLDVWIKGSEARESMARIADRGSVLYEHLDFRSTLEAFPQVATRNWRGLEQILWRLVVLQGFLERGASNAVMARRR